MSTTPSKARRGAQGFTANELYNMRVTLPRNKCCVTFSKMYKGSQL